MADSDALVIVFSGSSYNANVAKNVNSQVDRNTEGQNRSRLRICWASLIDLLDPPLVATTFEFSFQPDVDDLEGEVLSQQTLTQGQNIGIIVGAGQPG